MNSSQVLEKLKPQIRLSEKSKQTGKNLSLLTFFFMFAFSGLQRRSINQRSHRHQSWPISVAHSHGLPFGTSPSNCCSLLQFSQVFRQIFALRLSHCPQ